MDDWTRYLVSYRPYVFGEMFWYTVDYRKAPLECTAAPNDIDLFYAKLFSSILRCIDLRVLLRYKPTTARMMKNMKPFSIVSAMGEKANASAGVFCCSDV